MTSLGHTGRLRTSSAKDIVTSSTIATHIDTGGFTGRNVHETKIPDISPRPPVRGTGRVCSDREFGWSRILRIFPLIRHEIVPSDTANAMNGGIRYKIEEPEFMIGL